MSERINSMEKRQIEGYVFNSAVSTSLDGHLGVSKPAHRHLFFKKIGVDPNMVIDIGTVNGGEVRVATKADAGTVIAGCDGLITAEKNLYIALITADCLPVKLMDFGKGTIGLVHAGWRGLNCEIISSAIDKMRENFGSNPAKIEVEIAPRICVDHYEIQNDLFEMFKPVDGAIKFKDDKLYLDLVAVARHQLIKAGITERNINDSGICTYEHMDYFSNRRHANPGRFMTILGIKSN